MTETSPTLAAEARLRNGKGGAREARRGGRVPGVVYGAGQDPQMISVEGKELERHLHRAGFFSRVYDLSLAGKSQKVLPREVQNHPVSGKPLHVDFLRVSATSEITLDIEVVFENTEKCPGLKQGGVLNVVMHAIEVTCRPDAIPEKLIVDLSTLEIGDVVHLGSVALPAGVRISGADSGATIASIAAPTSEAAPEVAAEEGETPAQA